MPVIFGKLEGVSRRYSHVVHLRTDRPRFPPFCVCCGEPTSERYRPLPPERPKGRPASLEPFEVPLCSFCQEHWRVRQSKNTINLLAANVGVWGTALSLMTGGQGVVFATSLGLAVVLFLWGYVRTRGKEQLSASCVSRDLPLRAVWERGDIYKYSFVSEPFAKEFRRLNRDMVQGDG
ncbi:MAG: hypothetical protein QXI19_07345 [Candidatus Caldarchaeum sp.]